MKADRLPAGNRSEKSNVGGNGCLEAFVLLQLQIGEMDDVCAHTIQESCAVGHGNNSDILQADQIVFNPAPGHQRFFQQNILGGAPF